MTPYWITAKTKTNNYHQRYRNQIMDTYYPFLVTKVKLLLAPAKPIVFERDYKKLPSDSLIAIHAFLSPSVYFRLDCDAAFNYSMDYAFHHCPHEQEIRALMRSYQLADKAKEVSLKPDFPTFYKNVRAFQGNRFFYTLAA
jgi:hypothetical protein